MPHREFTFNLVLSLIDVSSLGVSLYFQENLQAVVYNGDPVAVHTINVLHSAAITNEKSAAFDLKSTTEMEKE